MTDSDSPQFLHVTERLRVAMAEIQFTFARSSGPGGQNVNKVNSKAVLRWHAVGSPSLPPDVRERFLERYASRLTTGGEIVIAGDQYRDQPKNIADCLNRLREMLAAVATPPKKRRPSKPTRGSRERRLQAKKRTSDTKKGRQRRDWS